MKARKFERWRKGIPLKAIAKIKMEKERWLVLCIARYSEYGRFGRNAKRGLLGIY